VSLFLEIPYEALYEATEKLVFYLSEKLVLLASFARSQRITGLEERLLRGLTEVKEK